MNIKAYALLGIAIIMELLGTTSLKFSAGFTKLLPSIVSLVSYFICFYSLSKALNDINLGIAYATWSAIGIVVSAALSAALFRQGISLAGVLGILLIVAGCVILNLFG